MFDERLAQELEPIIAQADAEMWFFQLTARELSHEQRNSRRVLHVARAVSQYLIERRQSLYDDLLRPAARASREALAR